MTEHKPEAPFDRMSVGGLLRCCIQTLHDHYPDGPERKASEGDVLPCKYCSSSVIFRDGIWRWNHD